MKYLTRTQDYAKQGYVDDDAKMIHDILEREWDDDVLKDKTLFYYDEMFDPSSFKFDTGEMCIKIYANDVSNRPMGIGFDSMNVQRQVMVDIRTMDRDLFLGVCDELERIFIKYRLRPGNKWDTLWAEHYAPVYPSYKFFHAVYTVHLTKYCNTLPRAREGWTDNTWY